MEQNFTEKRNILSHCICSCSWGYACQTLMKVKGSTKQNLEHKEINSYDPHHFFFFFYWNFWERILALDWQIRAFDEFLSERTEGEICGLAWVCTHVLELVYTKCVCMWCCEKRGLPNECWATFHLALVMPKPKADQIQRLLFHNCWVTPTPCNLFDTTANLNAPSYSRVLSIKALHLFLAVVC